MNIFRLIGILATLSAVYKIGELKGSLSTAYKITNDSDEYEKVKEAFSASKMILDDYRNGRYLKVKINGKTFSIEMTEPFL